MASKKTLKTEVKLEELLEVGAHFGHQTKRWNPKMEEYLYGQEGGVHIFDLVKTKEALDEALGAVSELVKNKKTVLLLGTKKQIKDKVREVANEVNMPYVDERWLGGTLSNFGQIKKSVKKLEDLKQKMKDGEFAKNTKKERLLIDREIERLERFFSGVTKLEKVPDALFVIDTKREVAAVKEASRMGVTVIGIVDSNSDPDMVDYPIPMNDDAAKALGYVLDKLRDTIKNAK